MNSQSFTDPNRIRNLDKDYRSTQTIASNFTSQTESNLFSLYKSFESTGQFSRTADVRASRIHADESLKALNSIEERYQDELKDLRKQQRELAKRYHKAVEMAVAPPRMPKNDEESIISIENDIKTIERLINNNNLEDLEKQNKDELEYVIELERKNKILKEKKMNLTKLPNSTFSSSETQSSRFSESKIHLEILDQFHKKSKSLTPLRPDSVKERINQLIKIVIERKAKYKAEIGEIKKLENEMQRKRDVVMKAYAIKEKRIEELNNSRIANSQLAESIRTAQSDIIEFQSLLKSLIREKEEIKRRNYTLARDKHANSEMMRRLIEIKKRVKRKKKELADKEKEMKKRYKLYKEELEIVDKKQSEVDDKEKDINALLDKLSSYGIDFQQKLRESQKELEALDLVASLRIKDSKSNSLEQQLINLLQEEGLHDEENDANKSTKESLMKLGDL
ncbi:hypothetical protein TRFO_11829 [Tritrichomonas foetus]|uniref:Uncharacterized protein n=1 Tax=Tritrichomonas foetus TaxID=1144522 RepID=A0A1J4J6Y1_9EUKA|nr:hypothetical protein TRFO_11829 [Tritrichomonas foetus]|eukprot:OHS93411.1 hypothetical protein TRFO_11829 [Tritrichomonas foetus]